MSCVLQVWTLLAPAAGGGGWRCGCSHALGFRVYMDLRMNWIRGGGGDGCGLDCQQGFGLQWIFLWLLENSDLD